MLEKEGPETPLLDRSDAAVKELIRSAEKRGYVTHDQINALLSSEEVTEQETGPVGSLPQHPPCVLDPHFVSSAMLVRESRASADGRAPL
jgi:hypothetical protein